MPQIDFISIILNTFTVNWWFIPLFILLVFFKSRFFKGKIGEAIVNTTNNLKLDKTLYTSLKDITIKLSDGSTTQIDHIIVSQFGIFVIETKNMKGWIYGSDKQKIWTQNIYGNKNTFQNPIHQNYKHIKAIEELLGFSNNIHSIVVFVGECKFKTKIPNNVFINNTYIEYIKSFNNLIFSNDETNKQINKIEFNKLKKGFKTDIEHISQLKERNILKTDINNSE